MKKGEWNVVFLINRVPPTEVILLRRSNNKVFAGGWYTGIGGKHEPKDKTKQDAAERELLEETNLRTPITHFATTIVDRIWYVYYFWGIFNGSLPECNEGTLEWIDVNKITRKRIVNTSMGVIREWAKWGFNIDKPFTIYSHKIEEISNGKEEVDKIIDGLHA